MSILLVQRNPSLTTSAYPPDSWTQMAESQKSVLEKFLANFFKYPAGHLTGKTCARGFLTNKIHNATGNPDTSTATAVCIAGNSPLIYP
jgi:hypothetical protein